MLILIAVKYFLTELVFVASPPTTQPPTAEFSENHPCISLAAKSFYNFNHPTVSHAIILVFNYSGFAPFPLEL